MMVKIEFANKKQFDLLRLLGVLFLFILIAGIGYSAIETNQLTSTGNSQITGDLNITEKLYVNTIKNREGSDLYIGDTSQSIRFVGNGNIITSEAGNSALISGSNMYLQTNNGTTSLILTGQDVTASNDLSVTDDLILTSGTSSEISGDGFNISYVNYTIFNNRGRLMWKDSVGTPVNVLSMLQNNMTYLQSPNGGITLQTKGDTEQSTTDRIVIGTGAITEIDIKNSNVHINDGKGLILDNSAYMSWYNTTGSVINVMKLNSANNFLIIAPTGKTVQIPSNNLSMEGNSITNVNQIQSLGVLTFNDGVNIGGTLNFTGGGYIQNGKLGTNFNTNGYGIQASPDQKDLKIQSIGGSQPYFRVISNDETNEIMRIYNGTTGINTYQNINFGAKDLNNVNVVRGRYSNNQYVEFSSTGGIGLRMENGEGATTRGIYCENGTVNSTFCSFAVMPIVRVVATGLPTSPICSITTRGALWYNDTGGCFMGCVYPSQLWVAMTPCS
jgi:hypothetical protein